MHINFLELLKSKKDEKYRIFTSRLLPKDIDLIGVRIPEIRKIVKDVIKKDEWQALLSSDISSYKYQEELILYALVLSKANILTSEKISLIKIFIPYINSWAVCDIFCADLKETKNNLELFYKTFSQYVESQSEYQIRFFYVLALNYFINEDFLDNIFELIAKQHYIGFYDKMAVAWFLSIAYIKYPQQTQNFLLNTKLDKFVFSKTVSKICDSFQVTKEAKLHLRNLASNIKN